MADVSAQEQLMLELVNRARMDPLAEAARFGIALNQGIPAGSISGTAKQALAMNQQLHNAADNHSQYMHLNDHFSHTEVSGRLGFTGAQPGNRIHNAGYVGATSQGENIAWRGTSPGAINATTAIIQQHEDLFRSTSGHRENMLATNWREVGIGQEIGSFLQNGTQYSSSLVTQNFAYRGANFYFTGVVYNDNDDNDFYGIGEGTGGFRVDIGGGNFKDTNTPGGYEIAMANGPQTVTFGPGIIDVQVAVVMNNRNIKMDLVNGNQIWTDSNVTLVANVHYANLLGFTNANVVGTNTADTLVGNRANNVLNGGGGQDTLHGNAGNDTLFGGPFDDFMFGGAGNDTFNMEGDNDTINDTSGIDTIVSTITRSLAGYGMIENLRLAGTNPINGVGNALVNVITGNNLANELNGAGGKDTLNGLLGDDLYRLGADADVVNDTGGIDTISSSITRNLASYPTIENLILGGGNINGTGNGLANSLTGGTGKNILNGGALNDVLQGNGERDDLTGSTGNDRFVYALATDSSVIATADRIVDFEDPGMGDDTIDLRPLPGPALTYIGLAPFSGLAPEVRINDGPATSTHVWVEVDLDGNGTADMTIILLNTTAAQMDVNDFLLV
jgi:Ca2+-binding RTX toxin-like protein